MIPPEGGIRGRQVQSSDIAALDTAACPAIEFVEEDDSGTHDPEDDDARLVNDRSAYTNSIGSERGSASIERNLRLDTLATDFREVALPGVVVGKEALAELVAKVAANRLLIVSSQDPVVLQLILDRARGHLDARLKEILAPRVEDCWRTSDPDSTAGPAELGRARHLRISDFLTMQCSTDTETVLVVWANQLESENFLVSIRAACKELDAVRVALEAAQLRVVVVADDDYLDGSEDEKDRRGRARDLEREQKDLQQLHVEVDAKRDDRYSPPQQEDDVATLSALFVELFDAAEVRAIVREVGGSNAERALPETASPRDMCEKAAEALVRRGHVNNRLFGVLVRERKARKSLINLAWPRMGQAVASRRQRLAQVSEELERIRARMRESTDGVARHRIDALEIYLRSVVSLDLRPLFERQRSRGLWGRRSGQIMQRVRGCIERGTFEDEILLFEARGEQREDPTLERLLAFGEVEHVVLFAACFLPELEPNDFFELVDALLVREQRYLESIGAWPPEDNAAALPDDIDCDPEETSNARSNPATVDAVRPPPMSLSERWSHDPDGILERCNLLVEETESAGRKSLQITWGTLRHANTWKELLSQSRHYFVTRQHDHLMDAWPRFTPHSRGDRLFGHTLQVLVDRAEMAPHRHAARWLESFRAILVGLIQYGDARAADVRRRSNDVEQAVRVLESVPEPAGNGSTWKAQHFVVAAWLNNFHEFQDEKKKLQVAWEMIQDRLARFLRAMQARESLQGLVSLFLNQLIGMGIRPRRIALDIINRLAADVSFDACTWLGRVYSQGRKGAGHSRERVRQILISQSFFQRAGLHSSTWAAVQGWLPEPGWAAQSTPRVQPLQRLGLDVAVEVALTATQHTGSIIRRTTPPLACFNDTMDELPGPLRWIVLPQVGRWVAEARTGDLDTLLKRVLYPDPIPEWLEHSVVASFNTDINARFDLLNDDLDPDNRGVRMLRRSLFVAACLVLWLFRLTTPDPDNASPETVLVYAGRLCGAIPPLEAELRNGVVGCAFVFATSLEESLDQRDDQRMSVVPPGATTTPDWIRFERMYEAATALGHSLSAAPGDATKEA